MDTTNEREGGWIQLISGEPFWPLDARPEDIHISDIAWSLGMQCRFGGHCLRRYSVAEHSVLVSRLVPPKYALWGLLHDATEAYLVDLPRPIKRCLPEYSRHEDDLARVIAERFGLPWPMPEDVKIADTGALLIERAQLMAGSRIPWSYPGAHIEAKWATRATSMRLDCWSPRRGCIEFLKRWEELS